MDKGFYKNAKDTLKSMKDLDPETASREQFIMLGACLSILADEEHLGDSFSAMEAEHVTEPHSTIVDSEQGEPHGRLLDEITDSEYYYGRYIETNKPEYLQMAKDEAHHFEMLSKLIRKEKPHYDFGELLTRYRVLLAKLV